MSRSSLVAILVGLSAVLACASSPPSAADAPPDWVALADVGTPRIVTIDPDGDERVTRIWLAVVDGQGFIRTGQTRWFRNIERDPDVMLRAGGSAHPLRAVLERDTDVRERVTQAFRTKYGFSDRLIGWFASREDANILRLVSRDTESRPEPR